MLRELSIQHVQVIITTLKPLTGDVNNTDHLVTMQCSAGRPWVLAFMRMPVCMDHTRGHCSRQAMCTRAPPPAGSAPVQTTAHDKEH